MSFSSAKPRTKSKTKQGIMKCCSTYFIILIMKCVSTLKNKEGVFLTFSKLIIPIRDLDIFHLLISNPTINIYFNPSYTFQDLHGNDFWYFHQVPY